MLVRPHLPSSLLVSVGPEEEARVNPGNFSPAGGASLEVSIPIPELRGPASQAAQGSAKLLVPPHDICCDLHLRGRGRPSTS